MDFYNFLLKKYGYDEPIFTTQVKEEININSNTLRQKFKRLNDKGLVEKVKDGIYFIPKKKPMFGRPVLDVERIIKNKFLQQNENILGYITGTNFANFLNLTSQTAAISTVVTNISSAAKREINFYNNKVIIKKPKVNVNNENYKLLQVLDLLSNYELYSEKPLNVGKEKFLKYLEDFSIDENELKSILEQYPQKTKARFFELRLFDEITRRPRAIS